MAHKKVNIKDLNMNLIKEHVKNHLMLVLDIKPFIDEGFFADDWGKITDDMTTREKNKIYTKRKHYMEQGFVLDIQTLNVMSKVYDELKDEIKSKFDDHVLRNPYKLLDYIDRCWKCVA